MKIADFLVLTEDAVVVNGHHSLSIADWNSLTESERNLELIVAGVPLAVVYASRRAAGAHCVA